MAKQTINLGYPPKGDGGDDSRTGFTKANANFDELYAKAQSQLVKDVGGAGVIVLSAQEALTGIMYLYGALTGNREVAVPDSVPQTWIVVNATTGPFTLRFRTVSGTGPVLAAGSSVVVFSDGGNVSDVDGIMRYQVGQLMAAASADVGRISFFAASTPPSGYLECNGAALFRSDFPPLFARIGTTFGAGNGVTTFNIPDLRGEFLRGWDHGKGVDPGRAFGSFQDQAVISHSHTIPASILYAMAGTAYAGGTYGNTLSNQGTGAAGGSETRPRNIALLPCIKY